MKRELFINGETHKLFYNPVYNLETGHLEKIEVFVDSEENLKTKYEKIVNLWAFKELCQMQKEAYSKNLPITPCSLLISERLLINPYHIYDLLLSYYDFALPHNCIEILSKSLNKIKNNHNNQKILNYLQEKGLKITLDILFKDINFLINAENNFFDKLCISIEVLKKIIDKKNGTITDTVNLYGDTDKFLIISEIKDLSDLQLAKKTNSTQGKGIFLGEKIALGNFYNLSD